MLRIRKFGENQSGYNAAHLVLLFLFCAARPLATASRLTSFGLPSASLRRISPESVFAKVMPRLERVAAVSALEDHAGDAALAKPIVAEVDDKPERNVHATLFVVNPMPSVFTQVNRGVVFYEPTMAARFWYAYAKRFADDAETEDWLFAFACAKGRESKYLDELRDPDAIQRALGVFIATITATKEEIERAVYFAAMGEGEVEAEKTELAKQREATDGKTREQRNYEAMEEIIDQAAAATGLTFNDLMLQTPSRLRGMIYAAHVQAGMQMTKVSAKAHADYLATLDAIAKRLRAEKAARDAAAK